MIHRNKQSIRHITVGTTTNARKLKLNKPRVLCVDDDPDISQMIEVVLRNYQVDLIRNFSGQQGIWNAISAKPDVIITDLQMQHGSGEELIECVRRNPTTSSIPIIVLSSNACLGTDRRLYKLGVNQFIQKPVHFTKLVEEIARFIHIPQIDWTSVGPDGVLQA